MNWFLLVVVEGDNGWIILGYYLVVIFRWSEWVMIFYYVLCWDLFYVLCVYDGVFKMCYCVYFKCVEFVENKNKYIGVILGIFINMLILC